MKIHVLNDNRTNTLVPCEHGLSFFIETDSDIKLIFDTGPSDLYLKNSEALGINANSADFIILSHGHWDHGNGLEYIKNKKLICHPSVFLKRYRKKDKSYIGLKLSENEIENQFSLIRAQTPYEIVKNVLFLGEIPRLNSFESKETPFCLEDGSDDFVPDDSALAIKSEKGLIVISGCAHSGICNTVDYARKVTGLEKVYAVIGGFHLKEIDDKTRKTLEYFIQIGAEKVLPCHCVEDEVINFFSERFGINELKAGSSIIL